MLRRQIAEVVGIFMNSINVASERWVASNDLPLDFPFFAYWL
jgi:hypothetical protein